MKNNFLRIASFFSFPALVFVFSEFIGRVFNAYQVYTWLDIPMHFLGGVAIACTATLFLEFFEEKKLLEIRSRALFAFFVLSFVAFAAVFWEFYEFLLKTFFNVNTQPSVADTITDLFMGFCGGLFGGLVFKRN